ncbi:MAG: protein kinase [Brasilonema octagenarum HA4186-MV1]|jgi:serine/threonine-protein kinase|uniref:non-specific serine/threonine protein kinase n=1 Tax=Brasilonema octagenarum UFV-OR1 TaxID=417115 RepID=A0ABX1M823_9CYAN|nr:serine/threonine-protein kinase [Brasilonema octagenarum]MBW4630094.1 protein kinase [Brasilonema octagenarum HA4186-MV1]NMF64714.1 serine/threonine protein kinase [Brasilonema octagenarum UFV-OR1]
MLTKLQGERYQVVQILGKSLFGQTYLVQDTHLPDYPTCVVKHFLPSSQFPIPVEIRRKLFSREVEALKKLDNYDLVPHLLAHFEDNLEFYLVQQFIEGHALSVELPPGDRWSQSKVFQLLWEVLSILNFVHSCGLIHRDVKPSNILRRKQDNRLVLIDFGAVKPIWNQLIINQGKTSNFIPLEYTTIAIGTPGYMPHEQQRGKPRPNSDIYALGMIAIQALTGVHPTQLPEDRNTGEILWQELAQVNEKLALVLNKMVCHHFRDRYNSAKEALEALAPLTDFYTSTQQWASTLLPQNVRSEYQNSFPEQNVNQVFENNLSAPLLNNQTNNISEQEIVELVTKLYTPTQESTLNPSSENDQTICISPGKLTLLTGLMLGVVSGLIFMVFSYWSVQMIAPIPKIQNPSPEASKVLQ